MYPAIVIALLLILDNDFAQISLSNRILLAQFEKIAI